MDGSNSFEKLKLYSEKNEKIRIALLDSVCGKISTPFLTANVYNKLSSSEFLECEKFYFLRRYAVKPNKMNKCCDLQ